MTPPAAKRRLMEQALVRTPGDVDLRLGLGAHCLAQGEVDSALRHAVAAAALRPDWQAELLLGRVHLQRGQADDAAARLHAAASRAQAPAAARAAAWRMLADLRLNAFGDPGGAAQALQACAALAPAHALDADLAAVVAALYEGGADAGALGARLRLLAARLPVPVASVLAPRSRPGQRLRIGLVSAQFCASPVGFLTLGALRVVAQQADLFFFDRGAKDDWARNAFQAIAHRWVGCAGADTATLHQLMAAADLDALIDLGGWTDPAALAAVAGRPARRLLKWVGGQSLTTGLDCFDGFVADGRQAPPAAQPLYVEPLLRATDNYVSYTAPPYAPELDAAARQPPVPQGRPAPGCVALVSNPAKISTATAEAVRRLAPRRLVLVDHRWRHAGTRAAAEQRLGPLMAIAEFHTPAHHPAYLETLRGLDALFLDTRPYAMGLTAIELRLLGKHVRLARPPARAPMCARHAVGHHGAATLAGHARLGAELLRWCGP